MADWYIPPFRLLFTDVQWRGPDDSICLTFDDGPHPEATPVVLKILREERIKATFFLLGENVEQYPDLAQQVVSEGHIVGNHTFTHRKMILAGEKVAVREVDRCQEVVEKVTGIRPEVFRPPHGLLDPSTAGRMRRRKLRTVMFSVDPWDYAARTPQHIVRSVRRSARNGDIIVLHDSPMTAPRIGLYLPKIIEMLRRLGHSFGLV